MRDFSTREKEIIDQFLITGSTIRQMFIGKPYRLKIKIDGSNEKLHHFTINVPTGFNNESINEDLVLTVKLLQYLVANGLCMKVPPASTYPPEYNLELGNSPGTIDKVFLFQDDTKSIVDFIYENWQNRFVATEPLRVYRANDYRTQEEMRHFETISEMRKANSITRILAIATVLLGIAGIWTQIHLQNKAFDSLNQSFGELKNEFKNLKDEQIIKEKQFKNITSTLDTLDSKVTRLNTQALKKIKR